MARRTKVSRTGGKGIRLMTGVASGGAEVPKGHYTREAVERDAVVGLTGGLRRYRGYVWELHPLAMRPDRQGCGIGRRLVRALEERAAQAARLEDRGGHPFAFYRLLGYEVVGLLPDANGSGRHDILMAKRVPR